MASTTSGTQLEDALRQCRSELAAVREHEETLAENQAEAERARHQLLELARHLDARLTKLERGSRGARGWVRRRISRAVATDEEMKGVRTLRKSRLFDGVWYLSTYPEVARSGLSPALHYLRRGAAEGKDPGPGFSTKLYLSKHPLLMRTNANPLLNHLRTGQ